MWLGKKLELGYKDKLYFMLKYLYFIVIYYKKILIILEY